MTNDAKCIQLTRGYTDKQAEVLAESIRNLVLKCSKVYAVTWTPGQTSAVLTRALDAVGMRADVGTDIVTVYHNDFDNIPPWNRIRCCGDLDANGVMHINAYEGQAGFATDGSSGNVWIEEAMWYYRLDWVNGFIAISSEPHDRYADRAC